MAADFEPSLPTTDELIAAATVEVDRLLDLVHDYEALLTRCALEDDSPLALEWWTAVRWRTSLRWR